MSWEKSLNKNMKKIRKHSYIRLPVGISLLVLGFIGGFIPIVQGWIFVFLGLTVLFGKKFTVYSKKSIKKLKNYMLSNA